MAKFVQLTPEEMTQILAQQPASLYAGRVRSPACEGGGRVALARIMMAGTRIGYATRAMIPGHSCRRAPTMPGLRVYSGRTAPKCLGVARPAGKPEWKSKDWKGKSDWKGEGQLEGVPGQ